MYRCIIQPDNSIEGDGMLYCDSLEAAIDAFNSLYGQFNAVNVVNVAVLCSEFISDGVEYVVDTVSRDGICKVGMYERHFAGLFRDSICACTHTLSRQIVAVWECQSKTASGQLVESTMRLRDLDRCERIFLMAVIMEGIMQTLTS